MKVTPLEIRQKTFEKGFRGYEKEEVEAYLSALSTEWEKMQEEARDQKTKIDSLEKELQKMREVESSLYKTLKTAETTGSNMVEQANKTAELVLKEAQMNADAILSEAKYQSKNILEEADAKAKNLAEEAKDHVKGSIREIKEIENMKDNLLMDLRNLASDTLERISKINGKAKKSSSANAPLFTEEKGDKAIEQILKDTPDADMHSEQKVKNGSFFDQV
jgi:cell division initiation protein